jgi:ribulose-phosphate 3-epimerase
MYDAFAMSVWVNNISIQSMSVPVSQHVEPINGGKTKLVRKVIYFSSFHPGAKALQKSVFSDKTSGMKTEPRCIVAPSILSADFSCVGDAVSAMEGHGAQWVHLDVMDGAFVPNISFGPKMIKDIRPCTPLVFDTHLMIEQPERYIHEFAKAGSDIITVHAESTRHLHRTLHLIHDEGKQAGVSVIPSTPISSIELILSEVQLVLIMSVNPGFGGQKFIPFSLDKIRELVVLRKKFNLDFRIAVDGGVNELTVDSILMAGADVLVVGSAYFSAQDPRRFVHHLQGLDV